MKDVEKKKKHDEFSVWSNGRKLFSRRNSRQGMPLTVAAREVGSKGSLMDRIRSLEDRLLQVTFMRALCYVALIFWKRDSHLTFICMLAAFARD